MKSKVEIKIICIGLFTLLWMNNCFAQLTVTQGSTMNLTPLQLVQNYLVGSGVTILNATYNNTSAVITSDQVGTFSTAGTASSQLGLSGGILMTSGKANLAIGPNNKGNAGANAGGTGDPDLNTISGTTTFDKAVLEFDFIPQFDTIRFRYVFGSEEFMEYCNSINDAFGFFISGPGISGTFSNNSQNIAIMPGSTNVYVTINNICGNAMARWDNAGGVNFQYDALTHVFTAWSIVQPCSTYHIKLAIADAVDHALDSGVFLEENSFSSPGISMNTTTNVPTLGKHALEGCNDVAINFYLSMILDYTYTVNYTIGGTAINGVDYQQIPNHITFPPGSDSVALIIHPFYDQIPEGEKSVILTVNQISCDGSFTRDTVYINDYTKMTMQPNADTIVCHGESIELVALVDGGLRPLQYQWNMNLGNDSIVEFIPPVGNNLYQVTVTDVCYNTVKDTALVTVHPKPIAQAGSNITIPNGTSTTLQGNAIGGYGNNSYAWSSNPPGFTSSVQNPSTGNLFFTTIYYLVVTDLASGCQSDPAEVMVIVAGGPLSANPAVNPMAVCVGSPANLYALAGGGSGLYTYHWSSNPTGFTSTEANPIVAPFVSTQYNVKVNDGFNEVTASTQLEVNPLPVIQLGPADTNVCIYDTIQLDAGNPGSEYEWSNRQETRWITVASSGIGYEIQTYKVIVTNENNCSDSAVINVIFSYGACTGVPSRIENKGFVVIPNPNHGSFNVKLNEKLKDGTILLYDLYGQELVRMENLQSDLVEIVADHVSVGLYVLVIKGNRFLGTQKVVIER